MFFLHREMIVQTLLNVPHGGRRLQAAHLSPSTLLIKRISIPSSYEKFCTYILK